MIDPVSEAMQFTTLVSSVSNLPKYAASTEHINTMNESAESWELRENDFYAGAGKK